MTTLESVPIPPSSPGGADVDLHGLLDAQRRSCFAEGAPTLEVRLDRIDRLDRLAASLLDNCNEMAEAIRDDFGNRRQLHQRCEGVSNARWIRTMPAVRAMNGRSLRLLAMECP